MSRIIVDPNYCKGCGLCIGVCPAAIIVLDPDEMTAKGYRAYRAEGKAGDRGELMRKFDKDAERVIFFRQPVGG